MAIVVWCVALQSRLKGLSGKAMVLGDSGTDAAVEVVVVEVVVCRYQ